MIWSDFAQLIGAILLMLGVLLPVVNPLGDAPIFLRMTPGCDELTRAFLAKRIAFYSFFLLLGSLLFGSFVLLLFGLSIPVVEVAGGAVVCALGWKLLADVPKPADVTLDPAHAKLIALGRAFSPLTLAMTGILSNFQNRLQFTQFRASSASRFAVRYCRLVREFSRRVYKGSIQTRKPGKTAF